MKNSKLIVLAILPFMLAGCGNQGQQTKDGTDKATYVKKSVDFSTEEGCADLISDLRKAVKTTVPAILKNVNLEFDVSSSSLDFKAENKFTNPSEERVNSKLEGKISDLKLGAKVGVKGLSTLKEFNDLVAYATVDELRGSVSLKQDEQTIADYKVPQIGLSAYLEKGKFYFDITKLSVDELKKYTASIQNEQVEALIAQLEDIKAKSNTFYVESNFLSTFGVDFSKFTAIKLDENFEATIDNSINYDALSTYLETTKDYLPLVDQFLEIGSDKNHKLIFTVKFDAVSLYGQVKEEAYKLYAEETKDSEEALSKEEFLKETFAESDKVMNGIKVANFNTSIKFNNEYVLSSLTFDANVDLKTSVPEFDDAGEEVIANVDVEAKGNFHVGLYVDTATDVATKLPDNLKDYPNFFKFMVPEV